MNLLLSLLAIAMLTATTTAADGPVRHVVHFKFKADAPKDKIEQLVKAFAGLPKQIAQIESFEHGTNVSPEGLSKGFEHTWIISFKDEADRDVYLKHAAHTKFVDLLKSLEILDEPLVVDFIPKKAAK